MDECNQNSMGIVIFEGDKTIIRPYQNNRLLKLLIVEHQHHVCVEVIVWLDSGTVRKYLDAAALSSMTDCLTYSKFRFALQLHNQNKDANVLKSFSTIMLVDIIKDRIDVDPSTNTVYFRQFPSDYFTSNRNIDPFITTQSFVFDTMPSGLKPFYNERYDIFAQCASKVVDLKTVDSSSRSPTTIAKTQTYESSGVDSNHPEYRTLLSFVEFNYYTDDSITSLGSFDSNSKSDTNSQENESLDRGYAISF